GGAAGGGGGGGGRGGGAPPPRRSPQTSSTARSRQARRPGVCNGVRWDCLTDARDRYVSATWLKDGRVSPCPRSLPDGRVRGPRTLHPAPQERPGDLAGEGRQAVHPRARPV